MHSVQNIDSVASFGILSPDVQHAIAASLGAVRRFDDHALGLLTAEAGGSTELILPNCSLVTEVRSLLSLPSSPLLSPPLLSSPLLSSPHHDLSARLPPSQRAMADALTRLSAFPLCLIDLGHCGRPMGPSAVAVLESLEHLHTLRLRGCTKLPIASDC